jgi:hypothetical protein
LMLILAVVNVPVLSEHNTSMEAISCKADMRVTMAWWSWAPVSSQLLCCEHDLYKIGGMLSTRGPRDDDMFSPFPNFYSVCRQVYLSSQATISIEPKQIVVVALAYSSIFCWWHPILSHELLFTVISLRLWLDKSRRLLVIN